MSTLQTAKISTECVCSCVGRVYMPVPRTGLGERRRCLGHGPPVYVFIVARKATAANRRLRFRMGKRRVNQCNVNVCGLTWAVCLR